MPKLRPTPEQIEVRRFNGYVLANMKVLGISQEDIAKCIGLSQGSISNRICEKTDWTLTEMIMVCELFGQQYVLGVNK